MGPLGVSGQDLTPSDQGALARVVVGGLLASTLVTLVLIPTAYASAAGLSRRRPSLLTRRVSPETAT